MSEDMYFNNTVQSTEYRVQLCIVDSYVLQLHFEQITPLSDERRATVASPQQANLVVVATLDHAAKGRKSQFLTCRAQSESKINPDLNSNHGNSTTLIATAISTQQSIL
ncbi:predicted protein [Coccidioides posadasii str. Silveira]|uniref:Predicted protein n=1 Tax=Coccidioides posadasii (strain RMSCC 757 / Silveira) TaxID=443226 RepID=E9CSR6_COCPS|nr:predicted protein [Coccidioides posadasii str. Silveira]